MRTPIIAGNWKMNKTPAEAVDFVNELKPALEPFSSVERVVIPAYVALPGVKAALEGSPIGLGAQDVHHEAHGAYTSSVAANMLQGLVDYVVIGHSETRQYLGVTDAMVNAKLKIALEHGLKVIVAMGENLEQNEAGQAATICRAQIVAAFQDIEAAALDNIVIAYEPVWAIGTGKNCPPDVANDIIGGTIRAVMTEQYGEAAGQAMRIQYGGSVKPNNMREYMEQPDIDGALVGGASLKVDSFAELVNIAASV